MCPPRERGHTVVHLSQRTVTFYHSVQNFWDNKLDRLEIGTEKNEMRVNLEKKNWAHKPRFSGRNKDIRSSRKGNGVRTWVLWQWLPLPQAGVP